MLFYKASLSWLSKCKCWNHHTEVHSTILVGIRQSPTSNKVSNKNFMTLITCWVAEGHIRYYLILINNTLFLSEAKLFHCPSLPRSPTSRLYKFTFSVTRTRRQWGMIKFELCTVRTTQKEGRWAPLDKDTPSLQSRNTMKEKSWSGLTPILLPLAEIKVSDLGGSVVHARVFLLSALIPRGQLPGEVLTGLPAAGKTNGGRQNTTQCWDLCFNLLILPLPLLTCLL